MSYKCLIFVLVIMQLRVKAMYGKIMSRLITVFWILEVLAVVALGVASLAAIDGKKDGWFLSESMYWRFLNLPVIPYTLDETQMCNPTYLPPFAFLFWVPIVVFETFLFSLALRMAYHNFQEIGSWRGVSLFHIILRDNFIFFVMYVYCLYCSPVFTDFVT